MGVENACRGGETVYHILVQTRRRRGWKKEEEKTEKRRMRLTVCYSILQQIRETEVS